MSVYLKNVFQKIITIADYVFLISLFIISINVFANDPETQMISKGTVNESNSTEKTGNDFIIDGPSNITLIGQAKLNLPENMRFVPSEFVGGKKSPGRNYSYLGTIEPKSIDQVWRLTVNYIPSGYIKTSKDFTWDVSKLLDDLKQENELDNKFRAEDNQRLMEFVGGWLIEPNFDYVSHEIRYATLKKFVGSDSTAKYVSVSLGREGFFSLNLYTGEKEFSDDKKYADYIFSTLHFKNGKRYEDFVEGKDRVAPYGITRLVSEVEPESDKPQKYDFIRNKIARYIGGVLLLIVYLTYMRFFKGNLKFRKRDKLDLNISESGYFPVNTMPEQNTKQFSLLLRLKEIFSILNKHSNKYFLIWASMIVILFGICLLEVSFGIPAIVYCVMSGAICFSYFVALARLTAYGHYEHFLYILPILNFRVLRVFGWTLIFMLIEVTLVMFAATSYQLGKYHLAISPVVGIAGAVGISMIALYLCTRLILVNVAVCYDIPSPMKTTWNATKGNVVKMLGVLLILGLIGLLVGGINAFISGEKPADLFNSVVITNPVTYLKPLFSTICFVTMQILLNIICAITGVKIFGLKNEQITR